MSNISTKKRKGEPQREVEEEDSSRVTNGAATSVFVDLKVLDCPICLKPLAPPIYQCLVGHLTCSSCYKKLPAPALKTCHHCSLVSSIYHRCNGIEKVVESIQIPCSNTKYGCTVKTSYHQKGDHKRKCPHAPCVCPETGCSFTGSTEMLLNHFTTEHRWPFTEFKYGLDFHAKIQDEVRALSCEDGRLFLLNVSSERCGSVVSVFCVDRPHDIMPKFRCDVNFNFAKKNSIHTQTSGFLVPTTDLSDGIPRNCFQCIVPKSYLEEDSEIRLSVKVVEESSSGIRNDSTTSVTLDLEHLECPVCLEPLAPPVVQCSVGHFLCSSCWEKLPAPKKCHHCCRKSTYNCCYGMEMVVVSIQIPCCNSKYGCSVKTSYHQKGDHERKCPHAPCVCPETGCSFTGSTEMLMYHFTTEHRWPFTEFKYGLDFHAKIQDGVRVLSCEDGRLFLLNVSSERCGSVVSVFCVERPHDVVPKFRCDVDFNFSKENSSHTQTTGFLVPSTDLSDGMPENYFQCIVPKSYLEEDREVRLSVKKI